jgi:hypothetical protein
VKRNEKEKMGRVNGKQKVKGGTGNKRVKYMYRQCCGTVPF